MDENRLGMWPVIIHLKIHQRNGTNITAFFTFSYFFFLLLYIYTLPFGLNVEASWEVPHVTFFPHGNRLMGWWWLGKNQTNASLSPVILDVT